MSLVTDVILLADRGDEERISLVNDWAEQNIRGMKAKPLDDISGGNKRMQCEGLCWGANYLDIEKFLELVASVEWEYPENVQVLIKHEHDERFLMINLDMFRKWKIYGDYEPTYWKVPT